MNGNQIIVDGTIKKSGKKIRVYLTADTKNLHTLPKNAQKQAIEEKVMGVEYELPLAIRDMGVSYQRQEQEEPPDLGNTRIEARIPYCLHLPNGIVLNVCKSGLPKARLVLHKVWTDKAPNSSKVDAYTDEVLTYHGNNTIESPTIPQEQTTGWNSLPSGKNIEIPHDTTGYYRYTLLEIFLNTEYEEQDLNIDQKLLAVSDLSSAALKIINHLLDIYRITTQESHVERLAGVNITDIYMYSLNIGYHPVGMNVEAARMNRPYVEISSLQRILAEGQSPALSDLLFLNAQASLNRHMYSLTVVFSFQAFEVFLENFLIEKYNDMGLNGKSIEKILDRTWRTKDRLRELVKEVTGHVLYEEDRNLWNSWCTMYDQVRNEVIHKGREATEEEGTETLRLNKDVGVWLRSLVVPGPHIIQPGSTRKKRLFRFAEGIMQCFHRITRNSN